MFIVRPLIPSVEEGAFEGDVAGLSRWLVVAMGSELLGEATEVVSRVFISVENALAGIEDNGWKVRGKDMFS